MSLFQVIGSDSASWAIAAEANIATTGSALTLVRNLRFKIAAHSGAGRLHPGSAPTFLPPTITESASAKADWVKTGL